MLKLLLLFSFFMVPFLVFGSRKVFVLHGYGSPRFVMNKIEKALEKENFQATNCGYKSMADNLDKLGMDLYSAIKESGYDTICFVTHSMGALVVRSMFRYIKTDEKFPVIFGL